MKTPKLLITLLLLHATLLSRADILGGPITNAVNGHVYYLVTENTWTASEAEAVNLGGHLATMNDLVGARAESGRIDPECNRVLSVDAMLR